jgi:Leucine-rich repeat (LRR) protein
MMKTIVALTLALIVTGCTIKSTPETTFVDKTSNGSKPTNENSVAQKPSSDVPRANVLDLSGSNLDKLPAFVLSMTNLVELNISNNRLSGALPSQIQQLKNLKKLKASNNVMTGIPAEIGQLSQLEELDFSNNQITGMPNELGNLKKLRVLNLSGNNFSQQDLAIILKNIPNLQVIQ